MRAPGVLQRRRLIRQSQRNRVARLEQLAPNLATVSLTGVLFVSSVMIDTFVALTANRFLHLGRQHRY